MTFDLKYGYDQTENKIFLPVGRAAHSPRNHDCGENAAARAARDRDYLFSRIGWFWERRGRICGTPEIYGIYPLFSGLSLAYVGGGPLGRALHILRRRRRGKRQKFSRALAACKKAHRRSRERQTPLRRTIRAAGEKAARGLPRDIAPLAQGLRGKKRSGTRTRGG